MRNFGIIKVVVPVALAFGLSAGVFCLPANAEDVRITLGSDILNLLDHNKTASLNASGELVDARGKIIGIVTPATPAVTVLKTKYPKVAVIKNDTGVVMAASLYNRIDFLKNLAKNEAALGHVTAEKLSNLMDSLEDAREELSDKIDSGDRLSFEEGIDVGEKLDQIAYSLQRADKFRLKVKVVEPMVISVPSETEPAVKRLTIYRQTVTPTGDVKTTTTTTTTTAESF